MLGNGVCEPECYTPLCEYDYKDCVDSTHPLNVFVSPTASAPFLGTAVAPYQSLAQALSVLPVSYLNVYLLAGEHRLEATGDLLASAVALRINIESALCTQWLVSGCVDSPVILQLTAFSTYFNVTSPLTVANVRIQGGFSLKSGCIQATCTYCPNIAQDLHTDHWVNDRNEHIDLKDYAEQSLCDAYSSYVLFAVQPDVTLSLLNVTFANIQHQPLALIQSYCGVISLTNVTFTNITVQSFGLRSGVVQWVKLGGREPYYCGAFTYETGTVELLNNGYEFSSHSNFSGFAYFSGIKMVLLANLQFLYNNMFIGMEAGASSSSLIFIEEARQVHVSKCVFKGNVADIGGALHISSAVEIPIKNVNGVSGEHDLVHVWIEGSVFESNTARIGAAVYVTFTDDHQNVWVHNCSFVGNVAWERDVLGVFNSFVTPDMEIGRVEEVLQGIVLVSVIVPPAYVKFTSLRVEGNIAPYFSYNQHIGVYQLTDVLFTGNGELLESTLNSVLSAYITYSDSYVSLPVVTDNFITCQSLVYLYNALNASITHSNFSYGYCPSGSSGVTLAQGLKRVISMQSSVSDLTFFNNTGNLLTLLLNNQTVTMANLNFTRNRYTSGKKSVCLLLQASNDLESEVVTPISVSVTDSVFDGNVGLYGTVGTLAGVRNFTLTRALIVNNVALSTSAGLVFTPISGVNSYFQVSNCTFRNNSAMSQGVVAILDTRGDITESQYTLDLQVTDCLFKANSAQSQGAAISSSGFLFLSSSNRIRNTRFEDNYSGDQGSCLRLVYRTGIVLVSNCMFLRNVGRTGAVIYSAHDSLSATPTYLKLEASVLSENVGVCLVLVSDILHPRLITSYMTFERNKGTCVHVDMSFWEDDWSVFRNNTAKQGGMVEVSNSAIGISRFAVATGNKAIVKGGAAVVSMYSNLTILNATLTENHSENMGGALYVDQSSSAQAINVLFHSNTCVGKGSAIFSISSTLVLIRSRFVENVSGNLGCIVLTESNFTMRRSELSGNKAGVRAPGIIAMNSNLSISTTTFRNQSAPDMGAFLYVRDMSTAEITECVFETGSALQGGAIFLGLRSYMAVRDSDFRLCSGEQYAGVMTCRICSFVMSNVTVEQNTAPRGGALMFFNQGNVTIANTRFLNYTGSAISVESSTNLVVSQATFKEGIAVYGAAIKTTDSNVLIEACSFEMSVAKLGGCVYGQVTVSSATQWKINITGSVFEHCHAVNGGAVFTDGLTLNVKDSAFHNNLVLAENYPSTELIHRARGAGVYAVCSLHLACSFALHSNTFLNNTAGEQGGALYWSDIYPLLTNNTYQNNTAEYGQEVASYPIRLASIHANGTLAAYLPGTSSEPVIDQYAGLGSGQVFDDIIRVALVDHYGNVVVTDNSSVAQLRSKDQSLVAAVGNVQSVARQGVFEFRNVSFLGVPDSLQRVHVFTAAINSQLKLLNNDPQSYYPSVVIELIFRNCTLGETQQGIKCYVCPGGTYSLDPDLPCKTCPLHAICLGNWTMVPESGYWRPDPLFETFFQCPNVDSCLGSPDPKEPSLTGECSAGYTGNLCSVCESGYSRQGRNMCNKCPNFTSNLVLSGLVGVGGVLLLIIAVAISIRGATRPRSEFAIYLKIFTNYVQMVVVAAALNVNWPGFVALFLNGQETVGSVTDQLFSFECLGQEYFSMDGIFYKKIIGYVLLPLLLLLFAVLLWCFIKLVTKMKAIPHKVVTSMVIIVFILHPSLTKVTFSIFSCSELLPSQYWLITDMSIRCWDMAHFKNIVSIALPSIIVWIFGLPLLCLGLLYRTRQRLSAELIQIKYSFLYKGYKPEYYYWEFVILYRKVALVCASVFLSSVSTMVQALSILAILLFCLFVHAAVKPFRTPVFNMLETKSILVSLLTIYVGLYFQANTWRVEINVLLFVVILLANIYFLVSWIRKIVPIVVSTIVRTFRGTRENLPVRPAGLEGADNSDLSNSKDSVLRAGDSRVGADRSPGLDIPPPNTTHGIYTLGLLDRPEDMRGKGELDYQFPDDITPGESQQDQIIASPDGLSPASPPLEYHCSLEEFKEPDPQLDETVDLEKSPIQPADKSP